MTPTSLWNSTNQAPAARLGRLRRLGVNVHLWIGLGLAALLIPISLSGALLVWHDHVDALVDRARYAITQGERSRRRRCLRARARRLAAASSL